jgi:hypothetical protein
MIAFYLLPTERVECTIGPKYLKWRYGNGLPGQWSLKDFGTDTPIALVASEQEINRPDVLALGDWTARHRDGVAGYLRSAGVESDWITKAADWREGLQRLAGMTQAMQAGVDNPNDWLGRDIYFGFVKLNPVDWLSWAHQQAELYMQPAPPPLRVRDNFRYTPRGGKWNWAEMLRILAVLPFAALPATDAFTGTNGTALTTYSSNWTNNAGVFAIQSNSVHANSAGTECGAHWNADTFNNNQYGQCVYVAEDTDTYAIGPAVRCAASGATYYGFYSSTTASYLFKMVSGTWAQLGSDGASWTINDVARLEVSGTTLTPTINGSTLSPPGAQTDSSIASGYAGITGYSNSTASRIDNWEGGNLGAAATSFLGQRNRVFAGIIVR